jgi:hypothetical protein
MNNKIPKQILDNLNEKSKMMTEWGCIQHKDTLEIMSYNIMPYDPPHSVTVFKPIGGFSECWDIESAKKDWTFYPYKKAEDLFLEQQFK